MRQAAEVGERAAVRILDGRREEAVTMRDPYNFEAFIRSVEDLHRREMMAEAVAEGDRVEASSYGVPGAVQAREAGSLRYIERIGQFAF